MIVKEAKVNLENIVRVVDKYNKMVEFINDTKQNLTDTLEYHNSFFYGDYPDYEKKSHSIGINRCQHKLYIIYALIDLIKD